MQALELPSAASYVHPLSVSVSASKSRTQLMPKSHSNAKSRYRCRRLGLGNTACGYEKQVSAVRKRRKGIREAHTVILLLNANGASTVHVHGAEGVEDVR